MIPTHHPFRFAIVVGVRFTITIGHEASGRLDFPIPAPVGDAVRRLDRHRATISYQAEHAGTTGLIARHTQVCNGSGRVSSCLVAVINVKPFLTLQAVSPPRCRWMALFAAEDEVDAGEDAVEEGVGEPGGAFGDQVAVDRDDQRDVGD